MLKRHEKDVHPRLVKCSVENCSTMLLPYYKTKHMKECHAEKIPNDAGAKSQDPEDKIDRLFSCTNCDLKYKDIQSLRKHCQSKHENLAISIRNATRAKKFTCDFNQCGRQFVSLVKLESHQNWHSNLKPYSCPVPMCLAKFGGKLTLQHHLKIKHLTRLNQYTASELGFEVLVQDQTDLLPDSIPLLPSNGT